MNASKYLFPLMIWGAFLCPAGAEVKPGDSIQTVYDELGAPRMYIRYDSREILSFDRGQVELKDGVVVLSQLISPEAAEAQRVQRQAEEAQQRLAEQTRRAQRITEGQVVREQKLADADFLNSPALSQVTAL